MDSPNATYQLMISITVDLQEAPLTLNTLFANREPRCFKLSQMEEGME